LLKAAAMPLVAASVLRCVHSEARYGQLLAPYLSDPSHLFIISSDFCHWGSRFKFTFTNSEQVRSLQVPAVTSTGRKNQCGVFVKGKCLTSARTEAASKMLMHVPCRAVLCCAVQQGPIWQSIKWLDELGMKIIEQVCEHPTVVLLHPLEARYFVFTCPPSQHCSPETDAADTTVLVAIPPVL
jgi:predicted class III extradiol MEMO1 family dioxygenase